MSDFTDEHLISRVLLRDDRNAFGELVRRYQSQVRGLLRRMTAGDIALADDLAQETFIKAYKNLAGFQGAARFSTWLYRIAYNMFISSRRQSATLGTESFIEDAGEVNHGHHGDAVQAKLDLEKLMSECSMAERAALALCYGRGMTHDEAAGVLGCPLGTVKTNVLRGKAKIRERMLVMEGVAS